MSDARTVLAQGSKSFALATRLLPRDSGDRAAIIYAWCRRADDAVDLCAPADAPSAVSRLRMELDGATDPTVVAFAEVCRTSGIPRAYPDALIDGMAADAAGTRYPTMRALTSYGYQVASAVGLMMCHVFGLRDDRALVRAAHLGIAMQLTNICRDVGEDWERGRLYLPEEVAPGLGEVLDAGGPPPRDRVRAAVKALLVTADDFYASGDRGIRDLPWRAGLAVRAARSIYARIGRELAARDFDPLVGRAVVPTWRKLLLAGGAIVRQLGSISLRPARAPQRVLHSAEATDTRPERPARAAEPVDAV